MDKITNPYDTFKTKISKYPIEQNHWQAFKDGTTIKQLKGGYMHNQGWRSGEACLFLHNRSLPSLLFVTEWKGVQRGFYVGR
nr:hypothetical protein [Bacillus altitudinis]